MFNFSWSEILVIGGIALIVIGPKDLPKALRTLGLAMRRIRGFAREFQGSIDQMVREAELEEAEKTFRKTVGEIGLPDLNIDHPAIARPVEPPAEHAPPSSLLSPGHAIAQDESPDSPHAVDQAQAATPAASEPDAKPELEPEPEHTIQAPVVHHTPPAP